MHIGSGQIYAEFIHFNNYKLSSLLHRHSFGSSGNPSVSDKPLGMSVWEAIRRVIFLKQECC